MKYKKIMFVLVLAVFLLSITCVSASEIDDTLASEDTNTIGLSVDNDIIEDNLQTSEENDELALTDNDETLSAKNDTDVLSDNSGTYSGLSAEIGSGGNIELQHDYYTYDTGNTISISVADSVIDGKGATINMTGSNIRAFTVSASGVTIKNLTIINANYDGDGGAIYFSISGTVTNCNFANNFAGYGGAVYFNSNGDVTNCNFTNNKATADDSWGGAIYMYSGTVTNCNFTNNTASDYGGAIRTYSGTVTNCNFVKNSANRGGAIFSRQWYTTADTCIFKANSGENFNTVNFPPTLNVDNLTTFYGSGEKLTFDLKTNSGMPVYNGNISISVYNKDNDAWIGNYSCLSGTGWTVDLSVGSYYAIFDTEYAEFKPINRTITITPPNYTFWALNHTINDNDSSEINLTNDYYYDSAYDEAFSNGIAINRKVTINGNGHTIDAKSQARVFYVEASDVSIENLTIKNANYNGDGGAVYFAKSGRAINCNFVDNNATQDYSSGGAIFFVNTGTVTNCNFTNNKATGDYSYGGAVYFYSTGNVTNCNFAGNNATGDGGAIFMGSGSVSNCNFTNNSARYGGAIEFGGTGNVTNCNFVDNKATSYYGGAVCFLNGTVANCNFTNNKATGDDCSGGAVYFFDTGTVTNCNFTNNKAEDYGGAIRMNSGTVTNCNFADNTAYRGGAVFFFNTGNVTNCNFADNTAYRGGAVYFLNTGTVTNCNFADNSANEGGAIYSLNWYTAADTCIFKSKSDTININVIIVSPILNVDNFTTFYRFGEKLTFNLTTDSGMPVTNGNISISVYFKNNNSWISNYSCLSGEGWIPDLSVGSYYAIFNTEYAKFQPINRTIKVIPNIPYYANVTQVTTNNKTVNITAKSNIPQGILEGKLLFILPNGVEITANYASNGTWWAVHTFDDYNDYQVNASYIGLDNVTITNATISITKANSTVNVSDVVMDWGDSTNVTVTAEGATGITAMIDNNPVSVINNYTIMISGLDVGTYNLTVATIPDENHIAVNKTVTITVNKAKTEITASAITTTYNINKDLVITLKDSNGNALSGVEITVDLNGAKTYTTDANGQVKVSTKGLAPKAYTAKITFNGNTNYAESSKDVKVTVKKATPKLTAKKKTFKSSVKTKKYTVTLKDNTGKAIKKAKVILKVKGKTYKATTNSKGKATFKIKKLNKKGTFKATVTYKGNKYYNKASKKAKIKVIVTFKTVSKGSKDKATVKEIQQALKNNGYYLTYDGHYLKIDGIYHGCTERSVREFQHDKGLKVTGKVDEKTAKKLGII